MLSISSRPKHALLGRAQRDQRGEVGALVAEAAADALEDADDLERLAVDGHRAADERGGLRLEALRNVGAEHDDARALLVLGRREESADARACS